MTTFRADKYPTWRTNRPDCKAIATDIINHLKQFDILIAHNGIYFDRAWLNTLAIKYDLSMAVRWRKFIDPVMLSRRHLRLGRNTLDQLIDYFEIPHKKTHVDGRIWMSAAMNGDRKSMDYIADHCVKDVRSLEMVYDKLRPLIEKLDNRGSAY